MTAVYVAAGSNVEPERNLARACAQIAQLWPDVRFSRAYRNAAVGFEGPEFLNAAAIIDDCHGAINVNGHRDVLAVPGKGLINGVVDHLVHEVVEAARRSGPDVHAGALPDRFQALEDLDLSGIVVFSHSLISLRDGVEI